MTKKFLTSYPVKGLIRQSKEYSIPGTGDFTMFELWQGFTRQVRRSSIFERAAAISFNVFMAIPPVLIFVFTLLPYMPISSRFIEEVFTLIRDIIPGEENNTAIISFLKDFLEQPRNELLSFGLLLALFFSSSAMMGILRSFDRRYEGFTKPSGLRKRKISVKLTLIVFFLVFLCIFLLIAQGAMLKWMGIENETVRTLISETRWLLIVILVFISIGTIYHYGAPVTVKWPYITPGAMFATTLMVFATGLVSYWVENFNNYNKVYGSISAVFILMALIYVNAMVILLGYELNVTIVLLKRARAAAAVKG